jgi:hypothetical protein
MKRIPGWLQGWFKKEAAVETPKSEEIAEHPATGFTVFSLEQLAAPVKQPSLYRETPTGVIVAWRQMADTLRASPGQIENHSHVIAAASAMTTIATIVHVHANKGLVKINIEHDLLAHLRNHAPLIQASAENYQRQAHIYDAPNVVPLHGAFNAVPKDNEGLTQSLIHISSNAHTALVRFVSEFEKLVAPVLGNSGQPANAADNAVGQAEGHFQWPSNGEGPTRRPF